MRKFHIRVRIWKAKELFTEHPDVDTLICATDTMAVGAAKLAKGERISDSSTGSDCRNGETVFWGKIIEPKLTTVHFLQDKWNGISKSAGRFDRI